MSLSKNSLPGVPRRKSSAGNLLAGAKSTAPPTSFPSSSQRGPSSATTPTSGATNFSTYASSTYSRADRDPNGDASSLAPSSAPSGRTAGPGSTVSQVRASQEMDEVRNVIGDRCNALRELSSSYAGRWYWTGSILMDPEGDSLKPPEPPGKLNQRTWSYSVLGLSIAVLLTRPRAEDLLNAMNAMLDEHEQLGDGDKAGMAKVANRFKTNPKGTKRPSGSSYSNDWSSSKSMLVMPNHPFPLDYTTVLPVLFDMMTEVYVTLHQLLYNERPLDKYSNDFDSRFHTKLHTALPEPFDGNLPRPPVSLDPVMSPPPPPPPPKDGKRSTVSSGDSHLSGLDLSEALADISTTLATTTTTNSASSSARSRKGSSAAGEGLTISISRGGADEGGGGGGPPPPVPPLPTPLTAQTFRNGSIGGGDSMASNEKPRFLVDAFNRMDSRLKRIMHRISLELETVARNRIRDEMDALERLLFSDPSSSSSFSSASVAFPPGGFPEQDDLLGAGAIPPPGAWYYREAFEGGAAVAGAGVSRAVSSVGRGTLKGGSLKGRRKSSRRPGAGAVEEERWEEGVSLNMDTAERL